jgi:hypothetical protein
MKKTIIIILGLVTLAFAQIGNYHHVVKKVVYYKYNHKVKRVYFAGNDSALVEYLPGSKNFRKYTKTMDISDVVSTEILDCIINLAAVKTVANAGTDSTTNIAVKSLAERKEWLRKLIKRHRYIKPTCIQEQMEE